MKIHILPILKDNYTYILESSDGTAAIVDPAESAPVIAELDRLGLKLTHILSTHHHDDHVGGNMGLKEHYAARIFGPEAERARIPGIDTSLDESSTLIFEGLQARILETPGHTAGHICFYFPDLKAVFTGDTLFSMGCGRLFEGTAVQMHASLQKIAALPEDTAVYCGHEYTAANGRFCQSIEPENQDIQKRLAEVVQLRANGKPSLPSTIGLEKKTNVFLRTNQTQRFAALREMRNNF